jgi:hypothetical protein
MKDKELEQKIIELGGGELVEIFNGYEDALVETDKEKELRTLSDSLKRLVLRMEEVKKEIAKNKNYEQTS